MARKFLAIVANSSASQPRLAVTIGDPAGIGPEVVLKALANPEFNSRSIAVIGGRSQLEKVYWQLQKSTDAKLAAPGDLEIIDLSFEDLEPEITWGRGNGASGKVSFAYLEKAIELTLAGKFDAIVTAPIAKSCWKAAGYSYPGQTEVLAEKAGVKTFGMLFAARSPHTDWTLRCLLATTHIPLRQVPDTLTPELMADKLNLLIHCLERDFGLTGGRIAIAGLNPHSGESGQLGTEEQDWLIPWIKRQQKLRSPWELIGPVPPDTLWVQPGQAWYGGGGSVGAAAAYLALYHDQGLIPVKLMAFDRAINTTIGLPFVRTSPDHGTAFDIAGKGIANANSMVAAIQLASELASRRHSVNPG